MNNPKTLSLVRAAAFLLLLVLTVPAGTPRLRAADVDPDTLFNCVWSSAANYPITVLDNAVTAVGGNIYSFGGVSTAITGSSFKFDGTTWTPIAALAVPVEYPAAVSDGTNVYVLGGSNG